MVAFVRRAAVRETRPVRRGGVRRRFQRLSHGPSRAGHASKGRDRERDGERQQAGGGRTPERFGVEAPDDLVDAEEPDRRQPDPGAAGRQPDELVRGCPPLPAPRSSRRGRWPPTWPAARARRRAIRSGRITNSSCASRETRRRRRSGRTRAMHACIAARARNTRRPAETVATKWAHRVAQERLERKIASGNEREEHRARQVDHDREPGHDRDPAPRAWRR